MKKDKKGRLWLWLLLIVILAVIGYYFFSEMRPGGKNALKTETRDASPIKTVGPADERPIIPEPKAEEKEPPAILTVQEPPKEPSTKEDYCAKIENNVAEFFRYLDQKQYVRDLNPKTRTYARFKEVLKRLAARTPVPAGEGLDSKIIVKNIYHFFRVLDTNDIQLITEVIRNERDTMEFNLDMFFEWLTLGERCPDPEGLRPSMDVLYKYAGFFLNTTGGRAYLFRRTPRLRLLVSYYSILIAHEADRKGQNSYGIDLSPYITPLKKEISRYSDFEFQQEYIKKLSRIEDFYLQRRESS